MSISINWNSVSDASGGMGLGAGIDVTAVVQQLLNADRAPESIWKSQQSTLNLQTTSWNNLKGNINSLLDKVNSLADVMGVFTHRLATSSQTGVLTASADPSAPIGNHVITVSTLATTSSYYTSALADGATTLPNGSFVLQIGDKPAFTITVDSSNNTLDKLAAYINERNLGVAANVVNDANGARLAIVSQTTGHPGDLTISANSTTLSFTKAATGTNAALNIDGVPISSASNTVSGALPGITLQLTGTTSMPVAVNVARDVDGVTKAVHDFVDSYNLAISAINLQFKVDPKTYAAGELASDSALREVQTRLLQSATFAIEGNHGFTGLASMGVNMQNDGTLTIDDDKLSDALANHSPEVQNFFQANIGFGQNFRSDLMAMTSVKGPIQLDLNQIALTQKLLANQIDALEDRLAAKEKLLISQYSQVNAALQQFPMIMAQISSQLSFLSNGK